MHPAPLHLPKNTQAAFLIRGKSATRYHVESPAKRSKNESQPTASTDLKGRRVLAKRTMAKSTNNLFKTFGRQQQVIELNLDRGSRPDTSYDNLTLKQNENTLPSATVFLQSPDILATGPSIEKNEGRQRITIARDNRSSINIEVDPKASEERYDSNGTAFASHVRLCSISNKIEQRRQSD